MKLAEALILRADNQTRLAQLKQRLLRNAKIQEGDKPAEDPGALLQEVEKTAADLQRLIQRINATNAAAQFGNGMTLSDALAARDVLRLKQDIYLGLAGQAVVTQDRYTKSEVKFVSTVDASEVQKSADRLAVEYRKLETKIQEANWQTDLIE
jgi:hypothetical protein